jgi:diguanylate cyclase (GGDEF)-like protein/PAS domain S-box-containing protein
MEKIIFDESLREILDVILDGVCVTARDSKIVFWNKGAEEITGYLSEEALNSYCYDDVMNYSDILGENLGLEKEALKKAIESEGEEKGKGVFLKRKDKKMVAVNIKSLILQVGEEKYEVEIFKKLQFALEEEGVELKEKVTAEALIFDSLTSLYSRSYINTILEQQYKLFKRHFQRFGLVIVEVDKFKEINEDFGRGTGDEVLKFVSSVLRRAVRSSDSLARLEGDKFIIACPMTELEGVEKLSERIVGLVHYSVLALSEKLTKTVKVSVSIGGVVVDYKDNLVQDVIVRAEEALSRAKRDGGNWYALG